MTEFDVETLSLKELKSLQKDLAKAISTFEDRQKSDARSKLEIIAKEMGYWTCPGSVPVRCSC